MPQRTFGRLHQTIFRISYLDHMLDGIPHEPLHIKTDVDDIFILGQHQRFVVIGIQFGGVDDFHALNQREIEIEARHDRWRIFTITYPRYLSQREFNATFLLINLINTSRDIAN